MGIFKPKITPPPKKKTTNIKNPHTHKQKRIVQPFSQGLVIRSLEFDNASMHSVMYDNAIQTTHNPREQIA